ncbi:MAG TPA: hypothetical protein VHH35_00900 [Pyrinomonadaceae bacterium]|nr:hypothetical protein [Pyrinomonadaceae bacterium]
MALENLAEMIERGLKKSSSAISATILHPEQPFRRDQCMESGINLAETSMRVYRTSRLECVKNFHENNGQFWFLLNTVSTEYAEGVG